MLRIAPGALHIQTFLGGGPAKPPSLPPIKCQNCSEDTKIYIIFLGENPPLPNQPITIQWIS